MTLEEILLYILILLIVTTLYTMWKPQHKTNTDQYSDSNIINNNHNSKNKYSEVLCLTEQVNTLKQEKKLLKEKEEFMDKIIINLRKESERQDEVNKKSLHIIKKQCDKSREAIERIKNKIGL